MNSGSALHDIDIENLDFAPLLNEIKDRSIVMIGESTHGTEEFYRTRAELTKILIRDHGFTAVTLEADWPDTYRVNQFVKGVSRDSCQSALKDYRRFPLWMWRNEVMLDFISWLSEYNQTTDKKVGVYGLDLYGIHNSINKIIEILETIDPEEAVRARKRYSCLELDNKDEHSYSKDIFQGLREDCRDEVLSQLLDIRAKLAEHDLDEKDTDSKLNLELNALAVADAEEYYRELYSRDISTWDIRDGHMLKCLKKIKENEARKFGSGKVVVWAHNSHVGDASANHRVQNDETTLGELARNEFPQETFLIGMTTCYGTVTAADNWGDEGKLFKVNPPLDKSHSAYLGSLRSGNFMLATKKLPSLKVARLERAIGVIYKPETEIYSHYFYSNLAKRFNWIIHIEKTSALRPLDIPAGYMSRDINKADSMDTFPTGL